MPSVSRRCRVIGSRSPPCVSDRRLGAGHKSFEAVKRDSLMMEFSSRAEVTKGVVAVVNQTIRDWDVDLPDGVDSETRLMRDLNFDSIDMVQFAVAIALAAARKGLPLAKLFITE